METAFLSTVVLPVGLAIIMLGLGLSLTVADFRRAATARRAVLNITLTAIYSVLSVITLPLVVWAATSHYFGDGNYIGLRPDAVTKIVAIVLLSPPALN